MPSATETKQGGYITSLVQANTTLCIILLTPNSTKEVLHDLTSTTNWFVIRVERWRIGTTQYQYLCLQVVTVTHTRPGLNPKSWVLRRVLKICVSPLSMWLKITPHVMWQIWLNWAWTSAWGWWDESDDKHLLRHLIPNPSTVPLCRGRSPQKQIFTIKRIYIFCWFKIWRREKRQNILQIKRALFVKSANQAAGSLPSWFIWNCGNNMRTISRHLHQLKVKTAILDLQWMKI